VLFGGDDLHGGTRSGGRYTLGAWFDPSQCSGIEVSYLHLADDSDVFRGSANNFDILARPYFDTVTSGEAADLIVYPGMIDGSLTIDSTSEFQSFEFYYRTVGFRSWCGNVDYFFGYRYLGLDETLRIDTSTSTTGGTTTSLFDEFDTETNFHGGVMGAVVELPAGPCWTCEAVTKLALGNADYRANIAGQRTTSQGASPSVVQGGLLALGTNAGRNSWDRFSAASEFGLTLCRQLPCGWDFRVGYNLIYWANVARSGGQIDRVLNTSQVAPGTLTGTARPTFPRRSNSFWAQGVTFGLGCSY
jgi:hypothetical protein